MLRAVVPILNTLTFDPKGNMGSLKPTFLMYPFSNQNQKRIHVKILKIYI